MKILKRICLFIFACMLLMADTTVFAAGKSTNALQVYEKGLRSGSYEEIQIECFVLQDINQDISAQDGKSRCSVNYKRCSQKTAQKYRTRYFKEKNMIKYKCKKNTRGNRNRYIK